MEKPIPPTPETLIAGLIKEVDKEWNLITPDLKLPEEITYDYLFNDENNKLYVPTKKSKRNQALAQLLSLVDYSPTEAIGSIKEANERLKPFSLKTELVWKGIPPAIDENFPHERSVIEYFIEKLGLTSLHQTERGTLYRNFDFAGVEVEFQKKDCNKPWRTDNVSIIKRNDSIPFDEWAIRLRSAAMHEVTVKDHLLLVHLTYANYLTQAVAKLTPDDPLYNLLIIHVSGSVKKNSDAYWNLFNDKGLVSGAANVTGEQIREAMKNYRKEWINSKNTYSHWRKTNHVFADTLYVQRGDFVYKCLSEYIHEYFQLYPLNDLSKYKEFWGIIQDMYGKQPVPLNEKKLKKTIVEILWRIIYFHYQVGTVMPYLLDSNIIRWTPGPLPNKGVLWSLVISFSTSSRQHQLITHTHSIPAPWQNLITKIKSYSQREPEEQEIVGIASWIWELELSVAR